MSAGDRDTPTNERKDELLREIVDAYQQWRDGSSSLDESRLIFAVGAVYFAYRGFDD